MTTDASIQSMDDSTQRLRTKDSQYRLQDESSPAPYLLKGRVLDWEMSYKATRAHLRGWKSHVTISHYPCVTAPSRQANKPDLNTQNLTMLSQQSPALFPMDNVSQDGP